MAPKGDAKTIIEIGVYSFSRLFRNHHLLEQYRRKLKHAVKIVAIAREVGQDVQGGDLIRLVTSPLPISRPAVPISNGRYCWSNASCRPSTDGHAG